MSMKFLDFKIQKLHGHFCKIYKARKKE